jgi:hypothetical protein
VDSLRHIRQDDWMNCAIIAALDQREVRVTGLLLL